MKKRLRTDNRGASLVLVISVLAIVTILVTIALAMGLLNYQMKATNRGAKNNFYDAERALDEIRLGLQEDVSDAISGAYVQTLSDYSNQELTEANEHFSELYVDSLKASLASAENEQYYDMNYLLGFLEKRVRNNTTLTASEGKRPMLSVSKEGVTLKNLFLTYVNEEDYVTRIGTDIQIRIPEINFSQFHSASNVVQYSLIGQKGITVTAGTGRVIFDGNVYAGSKEGSSSISIENGKTVEIAEGKDVVAMDTITVESGGTLNQKGKTMLWANDIETKDTSRLELMGASYVANDLTLMGGSDVTIGGEYYGFGNPKAALQSASIRDLKLQTEIENSPADYSSAVIVNAIGTQKKAKLNLKDVKNLVLAGNAYIGDSKVLMGESLTVKSNQIAYLVPESCMQGASNPMTAAAREAQLEQTKGDTIQDKEANFKNQILLRVQTAVSGDVKEIVQMQNPGSGLYYYYMHFSDAKAADRYFSAHYQSGASQKLKDYLRYYVEDREVKINTDAKKTSNGNILVYDENGITAVGDTIAEGAGDISEDAKTANQLSGYQDVFHSLNTNLSMDYASLTNMQRARDTVYDNLFNSALHWRLKNGEGYYYYYGDDDTYVVRYYNGSIASVADEKWYAQGTLKMIIASGDVTVDDDFDGLILCGGRIKIKPESGKTDLKLTSDPVLISKIIDEAMDFNEEYTLKEFMYDPDKYSGKFFETDKRSDNYIHLEDLVVYANWAKQ